MNDERHPHTQHADDAPGSAARRQAVADGLLPIVRIADQPTKWTIDERLAHYGCPGVGVATMRGGRIDWVGRVANTAVWISGGVQRRVNRVT